MLITRTTNLWGLTKMKNHLILAFSFLLLCGCSTTTKPVASPSSKVSLDSLKKLEGRWESAKDKDGQKETIVYKLTSGGAALEETLFPGTDHEMVSVYYQSGDTVAMTHYCMLGNRPQFQALNAGSNEIEFKMVESPGINQEIDRHMHHIDMKFIDASHIDIQWQGMANGKPDHDKELSFHKVS